MKIALKTVDGNTYTGVLTTTTNEALIVNNIKCENGGVDWIPHLDGTPSNTMLRPEIDIRFMKNNVIMYYVIEQ